MKLTELSPRWIHPNVFTFLCPHCKVWWLTCKNVAIGYKEQQALLKQAFGEDSNLLAIQTRDASAWTFTRNAPDDSFDHLTVAPSIDASSSGHWHGFITNGEIR
jgi:hypothetical protein